MTSALLLALLVRPVASYDIAAELDPATHTITAAATIVWVNPTTAPADRLYFHLYLNAFANSASTFFRESAGVHRSFAHASRWGWTDLQCLVVAGDDLTDAISFVSPDDGNAEDRTLAYVPLPRPAMPGEALEIETRFVSHLPALFARTGYHSDFHLVAQWFPKLAVYEEPSPGLARWDAHQFHQNSEFYADFGDYRIRVTVPDGFTVAGSGREVARASSAGRTTFSLEQDAIHDFAFVAAKDLAETSVRLTDSDVPPEWRLRAARLLGAPSDTLRLPPLDLRLLLPRPLSGLRSRILDACVAAWAHLGLYYGPYPYDTLTLLLPPAGAGGAGGMEYPTFITAAANWSDLLPPRSWTQRAESVVIHELAHQYFYGLLASNEFEHAWLDEGLATYAEYRCRDARAGASRCVALPSLLSPSWWTESRLFVSALAPLEPIDSPAWSFVTDAEYFVASYDKAALVLATAERLAGEATMARAMRSYSLQHRFTHPRPEDFFRTMDAELPAPAAALLRHALLTSGDLDYAVRSAATAPCATPRGIVPPRPGSTDQPSQPPPLTAPCWESTVVVERLGDLATPVDTELRFADGERRRHAWDGAGRSSRLVVTSAAPLVGAAVDPDALLVMDRDRSNNGRLVVATRALLPKAMIEPTALLAALVSALGGLL